MIVFSDSQLSGVQNNQPNLIKEVDMTSTTKSIEIVNQSFYGVLVEGDIQGELVNLPAMTTKCVLVQPGQRITFTVQPYLVTPFNGIVDKQSINMTQSPMQLETSITPLATLPVYNTPVNVSNSTLPINGQVDANITNASLPVSGSVNATIQNASVPVSGSVNATIQNASVPISGNVGITSGTVDANITNATITIDGNQTNSTGTLFADALTEYTGSTVPAPWTLLSGSFTFDANGATCSNSALMMSGNSDWKPVVATDGTTKLAITAQATFKTNTTPSSSRMQVGLFQDINNNYQAYINGAGTANTLRIYRQTAVGGQVQIATMNINPLSASTDYSYSLSLDTDGLLTATINGQSLTVTDKTMTDKFNEGVGGDAGVIITNAKVTGPIKTVAVAGDVNITNATLPISGNVGITSGTVDANIQNAQLDSNIINASVATNTLVNLGQTTITLPAINAGSSTTENINVSGENVFDNIILLIKSANLTTYDGQGTVKSPIEVLFQQAYFTPDGTIYYPIFVNGSGGGNFDAQVEVMGQNPSNGYTSLRVKIPNAIPVSQIQLMFKNVYTSATAQDTLTVHMFGQLGNDTQLQNDYSPNTYEIYNSTLTNSVASGSNFGGYVCPASNFVYVSFMCTWAQSVSSGMTVTLTETDSFTGLKVATSITPTYANNSGLYGLYVKKTALNFGDEISFSVSNNSGVTLTGVKQRILGWKQ